MSHDLDNWLRYFRDMGFTHLYRRAAAVGGVPRTEAAASASASILSSEQPINISSEEGSNLPRNFAALSSPTSSPAPQKVPVAPDSSAIPVVASPVSLFAAIERETLEAVREDLGADCRRCKLWKGRKSIVFGSGNPKAEIVFVGEGPGADEDAQDRKSVV